MKHIIIFVLFSFLIINESNAQVFNWLGTSHGTAYDIAFDSFENIYEVGSFGFSGDLNTGPEENIYTAIGQTDIYFTKYDKYGNYLWSKTIGSFGNDYAKRIFIDKKNNIFILGMFSGTVDVDPGSNTLNLTSNGWTDVYISKYDINGNMIWTKAFGGDRSDVGDSFFVDTDGNIYITGTFANTVDFDPSNNVYNLTSPGFNGIGIFVLKLDSLGNFKWACHIGNSYTERNPTIDYSDNKLFVSGQCTGIVDFDPDSSVVYNLDGIRYNFLLCLDTNGSFISVKSIVQIGSGGSISFSKIKIDKQGNICIIGYFAGTYDFDPDISISYLETSGPGSNAFLAKYDPSWNFLWVKKMETPILGFTNDYVFNSIDVDKNNDILITLFYNDSIRLFQSADTLCLYSIDQSDVLLAKVKDDGQLLWAGSIRGNGENVPTRILVDKSNAVLTSGYFLGTTDFDPDTGVYNVEIQGSYGNKYLLKLLQNGVTGKIFNDFNSNCILDTNEVTLAGRFVYISPDNIISQTNSLGIWCVDSLPIGYHTAIADTSDYWQPTCTAVRPFDVIDINEIVDISFGLLSSRPCAIPDISIYSNNIRRCFSNQIIYVSVCNQNNASGILINPYVDLRLDSLIIPQSASLPFTSIGNCIYRFQLDTIYQGQVINFSISCYISCDAVLGQTLCMYANLSPADTCVFDTIPLPPQLDISECTQPWDRSSLSVEGYCQNDSIYFVIKNNGVPIFGDMVCWSPVRIFIDGIYTILDSVFLAGGDSIIFVFAGDGRTWRLETEQHPLHPGNSHPNATVELCGNPNNWTSDMVNILPHDDADPIVDIYCGVVTGSYDPNDKTGYPIGITNEHFIKPEQQLQYVIRFQNTGTDTAFTVIIRDTLDNDLDIFSVESGVSSHSCNFLVYGPRVLEWRFDNILLPDSNTNEQASHGFVTFKANPVKSLPDGTVIENKADIYFDYNAPVTTNLSFHTIHYNWNKPTWENVQNISVTSCDEYRINGYTYIQTGSYLQPFLNNNIDSLYNINLTINNSDTIIEYASSCDVYLWPENGIIYDSTGVYSEIYTNFVGCDSVILLDLKINKDSIIENITTCSDFIWSVNGQTYVSSGLFIESFTNIHGCDSVRTLNLTINNSTQGSVYVTSCDSYLSPSGIYNWNLSGTYHDTIPNLLGCDSMITIYLTINNTSSDTTTVISCDNYVWPVNGQSYSSSGLYLADFTNQFGCDSVKVLDLSINQSNYISETVTECDTFIWAVNGQTYTSSGTFTEVFTNVLGCDSVKTLNLTIINSTQSSFSITSCDSYQSPSGLNNWNVSGIYHDTILNISGCDSLITIDLTIYNTSQSSVSATSCDSYQSPSGIYNWTISGTYHDTIPNILGCDSIITIDLALNYSETQNDTFTACDSYTWPVDGNTYTSGGLYTVDLINQFGCDSTRTLNLTLHQSNISNDTIIACNIYTWEATGNTYNTGGIYIANLYNQHGCDSTITLDLTINTADASVTESNGTLSSIVSSAAYQWLDCNNSYIPVVGESGQSFTPLASGDYALEITMNNCVDTSECVNVILVGISERTGKNSFTLMPNPAGNIAYVEITNPDFIKNSLLVVCKNSGEEIIEQPVTASKNLIDVSVLPDGVYFVKIICEKGVAIAKMVVQ